MSDEYRNGGVSYDELITLTDWMARNGFSAGDVAYAVEKPWKYLDELAQAKAEPRDEAPLGRILVEPEGREGVWLADRASLKAWIVARHFEQIHNFVASGPLVLGADHDVEGVLGDIDRGERVAILTGSAAKGNLGHALAIIYDGKLEMYDIGEVTEDDLDTPGLVPGAKHLRASA